MTQMEDYIEIIKRLECPTGELENRISQILENNRVGENNELTVKREPSLDENDAEAFTARINEADNQKLVILAKSGYDDYVAKVVDAYIN